MTKASKTRQSPLKVVVVVLAVVVALLFASSIARIDEVANGHYDSYKASEYRYPAENGRYGWLYDTALQDMAADTKYDDEVLECRALGFYYEQAVLEHAYRTVGDNAKADAFAERMAEYEAQLGSLAGKAADVRAEVAR